MFECKYFKLVFLFLVLGIFLTEELFSKSWKYYYDDKREKKQKRIALIVGINDFDDPYWPSLKFAEKDARDIAWALTSSKTQFDKIIILNRLDNTDKRTILKKINEVIADNSSEDDTILIYFSTHGTIDETENKQEYNQYLIAKDTMQSNLSETGISVRHIKEQFNLLNSTRKLLIIASCYSGIGKSKFSKKIIRKFEGIKGGPIYTPFEKVSEASIILSASRLTEPAREDKNLKNDIYTHFFIQGLNEIDLSDKNKDGAVSALEAHDFAKELTYLFTNGQQIPTAHVELAGKDPVILSGIPNRRPNPSLYAYSSKYSKYKLYADGQAKGVFPGLHPLEPGSYKIEIRSQDDKVVFSEMVKLKNGDLLSVSELIKPKHSEIGIEFGGTYLIDERWREKVGADIALEAGLYYTYNVRDIWRVPFKIRGEFSYTKTLRSSVDDIYFSQFEKFDFKIAPLFELLRFNLFALSIYAGAGATYSNLNFFVSLSKDYKTNDNGFSPNFFGGLAIDIKLLRNLYAKLASEINYLPISYSFGKINYLGAGGEFSLEVRF